MILSFKRPSPAMLASFLKTSEKGDFTYIEKGRSIGHGLVKGFDNDHNEALLGHGEEIFQKACSAIRQWKMFPGGWAYIAPADAPIEVGQNVVMVARIMGLYWLNDCRIVYLLDERRPIWRYGFAYGTLGQHVEKGEELFSVEMRPDDSVWYVLRAFSKPRFWLARLGYPLARFYQKKFVRESKQAMLRAVGE